MSQQDYARPYDPERWKREHGFCLVCEGTGFELFESGPWTYTRGGKLDEEGIMRGGTMREGLNRWARRCPRLPSVHEV